MLTKQEIQDLVEKYDLLFPFDNWYPVTSNYKSHLRDKKGGRNLFPGVDYAVWYGRPIKAIHDGKLVRKQSQGFGKHVILSFELDGKGYEFLFGHLSEYAAKTGEVKRGQIIGHSGNSGYVFAIRDGAVVYPSKSDPYVGTHVHFGGKVDGGFIDGQPWIRVMYDHLQDKLKQLEVKPTYDELRVKLQDAESQIMALQMQLEAYESIPNVQNHLGLSEPEILDINQISMETTKTISEKMVDGGKYIVFAQPIGALLGLVLAQLLGWVSADQIAVAVAGVTATVNFGLIIFNHKFKFM